MATEKSYAEIEREEFNKRQVEVEEEDRKELFKELRGHLRDCNIEYKNTKHGPVGSLGIFTFEHKSYYWVVEGNVPLAVAQELYAHPICKKYVRVIGEDGHNGSISPNKAWVQEKIDGEVFIPYYHIDNDAGLYLFVEILRRCGLV